MKKRLLTSLSLALLALFFLPNAANAWNDVYLNCELSSWGNNNSYKFTKVNDNEFYYSLPVSNITEGDFYFRYSVDPNQNWGQSNWGPATDGDVITATDYPNATMNSSNAFKIAQSANATSCTIRIKYNNSTGNWTWHVTAEIVAPDIEKTDYTVSFNDPGWEEVYAFVWGGGTEATDVAATWPGEKLTKSGNAYTFTYSAYSAPANIIFNNGNGNGKQTPDLAFEADKTYTNVFSIIGDVAFIGAWNTAKSLDMTEGEDGKWTLVIDEQELSVGSFAYKAIYDHAWGIKEYPASGNNTQVVSEDAKYKITFTLDPSASSNQLTCALEKIEEVVISHAYTVVGQMSTTADGEEDPIFGTAWDVNLAANDLTKDETTGVYSWTKENVTLNPGTVYYKVAQDHSWEVSYGYSSGQNGNADYVVSEGGIYTVAFHFDPSKTDEAERLYAEFTKTADLPAEPQDFTVSFTDPGWDEVYAFAWTGETPVVVWPGTKLEKTGDVYTYTVNAVAAPANIIFNNGDGNGKQTPDLAFEDGKTYTHVWSIAGKTNETADGEDDIIFSKPWDVTIEANNLTEGEDGTWTLTKEVELTEETSILFKAVYGHAWDISYGKADGSNQDYNNIPAGKYNVTFTYDPSAEGDKVTATFEEIVVTQTVTATFVNTGDWEKVYAWAWTTEGEGDEAQTTNFFEPWPGMELTEKANEQKDGHDVYTFTYTGKTLPANILFNNGEGTQTDDFELVDGEEYSYTVPVVEKNFKAYFVNMAGWETVKAHAWNVNGNLTTWPGDDATAATAVAPYGTETPTFEAAFAEAPTNVIFHNNDNTQTGNMTFLQEAYYTYDGLTSTSKLLFLDIDKEYTIASETAVEGMNVCLPRHFTPGQKSTVCLPFALTAEQAAAAGKFYRLISVTGTEVKYEEVTSTEANTPYLFIAAEGVEYPFENIYVETLPATVLNEVTVGEAKMMATLETIDLTTDEETTYFGYNSENGKWTKATVGTLKPFRACLAIPSSSAAAKASELDDNLNTTGINTVNGNANVTNAAIYDLQGRKIVGKPSSEKGIYIMNGKKYVVK